MRDYAPYREQTSSLYRVTQKWQHLGTGGFSPAEHDAQQINVLPKLNGVFGIGDFSPVIHCCITGVSEAEALGPKKRYNHESKYYETNSFVSSSFLKKVK